MKIVLHLSPMLVGNLGNRLQFNNDLIVTDEVRYVVLLKRPPFVAQRQWHLRPRGDAQQSKLDLDTLLENRLQKTAALVLIDFEAGPQNPVRFILMQ